MQYEPFDSSGTDDDLPPVHQTIVARGHASSNGRGTVSFSSVQHEMESEIYRLEQEAYSSLLRAFKAQSDAISWEKEGLITELRKELRVSDEEHRELLSKVNDDGVIRKIRSWRQSSAHQSNLNPNIQVAHEGVNSPTISASHKRHKTSYSVPLVHVDAQSPVMHVQVDAPKQPFSANSNWGKFSGIKSKNTNMKIAPTSRGSIPSRSSSGALAAQTPVGGQSLIGRKVMTKWPEDDNFYEAVIRDYNPLLDQHALVYDVDTPNESWEWIDLKEIAPEDIRWSGDDPGISNRQVRTTSGPGVRKSTGHTETIVGAARVRGKFSKSQSGRFAGQMQNGTIRNGSDYIEVANTDNVLKEVERILTSSDLHEIEKAKKLLKDHEQSLLDAIAKLADGSDCEN